MAAQNVLPFSYRCGTCHGTGRTETGWCSCQLGRDLYWVEARPHIALIEELEDLESSGLVERYLDVNGVERWKLNVGNRGVL